MQESTHKWTEPAAYSVEDFCAAHGIARSFLYKLWREGRGPRAIKLGRRRLISREEAALWRERMVAESEDAEAAQAPDTDTSARRPQP